LKDPSDELERSESGKAGEAGADTSRVSVCSWNINNRVGKTASRPEAAHAAIEIGTQFT